MVDLEAQAIVRRLARVEGQVRGVRRLVEEGAYCLDILNQVHAAANALNQVAASVARQHLKHCILDQAEQAHPQAQGRTREELLDELDEVLAKLVR